jgi:hypothetical protein
MLVTEDDHIPLGKLCGDGETFIAHGSCAFLVINNRYPTFLSMNV